MERTRKVPKCAKMKLACARRAKLLFFIVNTEICDVFGSGVVIVALSSLLTKLNINSLCTERETYPAFEKVEMLPIDFNKFN